VDTRARIAGFTLIELLISIAIMSMVIGLASYGFSLFSQHWDGPRKNFDRSSGQVQRLDLLMRSLGDAIPWVVRDDSGQPGFYFLGREEGVTLVTASPIYSTDTPAVIRVFREPQSGGTWRLVYEEAPLSSVRLVKASQTLPFQHRLIILENMRRISFRYLGWNTAQERFGDEVTGAVPPQWFSEFDGLVRTHQPSRVGLTLGEFETSFSMPDRTSVLLNRVSPAT
jgi:prepilin-type N-terminal cleavage/methylation domain-containing protein